MNKIGNFCCVRGKMTSCVFLFILMEILASVSCKYILDMEAINTLATGSYNFTNVKMHPVCRRDYCFEVPEDYPRSTITTLLKKQNLVTTGATVGADDGDTDHSIVEPCKVNRTLRPIYQIKDDKDRVRFVAQSETFKQIITVEECSNPGEITEKESPFDLAILKSMSYKAVCAESYRNFPFLVLSLDGQSLETVRVGNKGISVCCRCEIQSPDYSL